MMKRVAFVVVLIALTMVAPSAGGATRITKYATPIDATWTSEVGVPTSADIVGFPFLYTGVSTGTTTGSWAGQFVAYGHGEIDEQLAVRAVQDVYLSGRASDGSCGTLHIRQWVRITGDELVGQLYAKSKIVKGTGAWKGSTGSYIAEGIYLGGVGHGVATGTWWRPGPRKTANAADCRPGLPPLKL